MRLLCVSLVLALAAAGQSSPKRRSAPPRTLSHQPIAFSHKIHSAQGLDCAFCHSNPDPGETMTIPDAEFCMNCHTTVASEKPAIKKLSRVAQSKKPIAWVRIYSLPGFVFWSHRTHLTAGQSCQACHGDVGNMAAIRPTNVTTMDGCVDCHNSKEVNAGCSACHEGRSS